MAEKICPYCQANNEADASFCAACGMALPRMEGTTPRVVAEGSIAATAAGQDVQGRQLKKKLKNACTALFAVAILQSLATLLVLFVLRSRYYPDGWDTASEEVQGAVQSVILTMAGIAVAFAALGFWARKSPLPATIIGLVLYLTAMIADAVMEPETIAQGLLVKAIIIAVLAKGISAAVQYRKLKAEAANTAMV